MEEYKNYPILDLAVRGNEMLRHSCPDIVYTSGQEAGSTSSNSARRGSTEIELIVPPVRTVTNLLWFAVGVLLVLLYAVNVYPHGEAAFESRFDKVAAQAQEMKEGALRDGIFFDESFFDEIFFLLIASGIGVGISLLTIWWTRRRGDSRSADEWTLTEGYRSHLIFVKAHQEPDTDRWRASVHVQFNEATFRDVRLPGSTSHFPTKTTAKQQALKEAKLWVDERLRKAKIRAS